MKIYILEQYMDGQDELDNTWYFGTFKGVFFKRVSQGRSLDA